MSLNFKFSEKNEVLKEISVELPPLKDYTQYRNSLKLLQKEVNEYLTTLVTKESASAEPEKEDDFSDSDLEQEKSPKRTLSSNRGSQKAKVKKC